MLITIIDHEVVATTCSRTFLKFNFLIRSQGYTLDTFATSLDQTPKEMQPKEIRSYSRLVREFKKKTGLDIELTKKYSYDSDRRYSFGQSSNPYKSIDGRIIQKESLNRPLWITPLKLAPELRRIKASMVIVN